MLLLLLSFYVHYDLLNCEEIVPAKFNESLLVDHHRQNLLHVNALLEDLEQKTRNLSVTKADDYENDSKREEFIYENIPSALRSKILEKYQNNQNLKSTIEPPPVYLPSPQYDPHQGLSTFFPGSHTYPAVIPPDPTGLVKNPVVTSGPQYPGHQLKPMPSSYPGPMMPSSILSENGSGHYTPNYLYPQNIFRPREQGLYKEPPSKAYFHMIPLHPIFPTPPSSLSFYVLEHTPRLDSTLTKTIRTTTIGANAKIWLKEIAPYTRVKKKMKKASKGHSRPYHKRTTVPPRITEPRNDWSLTANTVQLFHKVEYGFLHVALAKTNATPGIIQETAHKNGVKTTAGDVLYGRIKVQQPSTEPPKQRHLDLMKQLEEGYLMVFAIEMFRLIAVKDKHEVRQVLAPMEPMYNTLSESGRLAWVGDPLLIFIEKLSTLASSGGYNIDAIRTYSSLMFHSLLKRKELLSPEENSIIADAESFYSDKEGNRLLRSLSDFEDYPHTTKSSSLICEGLIENILQPFRRRSALQSRELVDKVNRALRQRFPLLRRERIRSKVETHPSKRKRKHHHKRKRKRKRYLKPENYYKQIHDRLYPRYRL